MAKKRSYTHITRNLTPITFQKQVESLTMWKKFLILGILLSSSLLSFTQVEAKSQIQETCVKKGGNRFQRSNDTIVIQRKIYNPDFKIHNWGGGNQPGEITCQISERVETLNATFALPDDSRITNGKIQIYLDGNLAKTITINKGTIRSFSVNFHGATNYTLVFTSSSRGYFYVLQWDFI